MATNKLWAIARGGGFIIGIVVMATFGGWYLFSRTSIADTGSTRPPNATTMGEFDPKSTSDPVRDAWRELHEGVVISEIVARENPTNGSVRGQFVELYCPESSAVALPRDLSGWKIESSSGAVFVMPTGTQILPGRMLVVDFAGGLVAARVEPWYGATVVTTRGFLNNFTTSATADGLDGCIVLRSSDGTIRDGVVWGRSELSVSRLALRPALVASGRWKAKDFVRMTFLPHVGDYGIARTQPDVANERSSIQWAEGNNVGPTPGAPDTVRPSDVRLRGTVVNASGAPIPNAAVSVLGGPEVTSGTDGRFEFAAMLSGTLDLRASASGYLPCFRSVRKSPFESVDISLTLSLAGGPNAVAAVVPPSGTTVTSPMGDFEVHFPAGFVSKATAIQIFPVRSDGQPQLGTSIAVADCLDGQADGIVTAFESTGGVFIEPAITSATPGVTARVRIKAPVNPVSVWAAGDVVLVETISPEGMVDRHADGQLVALATGLFAEVHVPHFCFVAPQKPMKIVDQNGTTKYLRIDKTLTTMDCDDDGVVDFRDTFIGSYALCPQESIALTLQAAWEIRAETTEGWQVGGEISGAPGWLAKLVADGSVKISGGYTTSQTTGQSISTQLGSTFTAIGNGANNDQQEVNIYVRYRRVEGWLSDGPCIGQSGCASHAEQLRTAKPNVVLMIPIGYGTTRTVIGHC